MIGRLRISLAALRHNGSVLCRLVGPQRAAFVVKGNGYGHGLVETARAVEPLAMRLCVYGADEGLALRAAGIAAPILVLGPVPPEVLDEALGANLELAVWNVAAFARRVAAAAGRRRTRAFVHLKVNTDLNRLGVEPEEMSGAVERLLGTAEITLGGIFSHLAAAEEIDSPYTMHQLGAFERALREAKPLLDRSGLAPIRHIAASAAAMLWPQTHLDMARFGIALYGLMPSPQTSAAMNERPLDLRPALSYASELIVVRTVTAGASVGYGGSFHAPRDMRVGVVPAGYADGVPRALSNRGAFIVDGALCPIVGRVAMNMTQIDLSNAPNAHVGSLVTLIGSDGESAVTADDWAAWSDTINYEIVARLPSDLPREFVE
ncbi:MAG: alanine racemase [Candidatus Cybelea sp.]